MYDDAFDIEGNLSSAEDALLDDIDQSSNAESTQSCSAVKYWQDWQSNAFGPYKKPPVIGPPRLYDLSCDVTAKSLSFEQLELHNQAIENRRKLQKLVSAISTPLTDEEKRNYLVNVIEKEPRTSINSDIFIAIIKKSFPTDDKDIQLYCCLAHGTPTCYKDGETIFKMGLVKNMMQIGYLINAEVEASTYDGKSRCKYPDGSSCCTNPNNSNKVFHVTICVDRQRIISATCTCTKSTWCHHIIAAALYRIYNSDRIEYRTTIFDSVNELDNEKLKKLFQYFITALPPQYLSTGQKFIDDLKLSNSTISILPGAPDPTDGGHDEVPIWNLDESAIRTKLSTVLINFIKPKSILCEPQLMNIEHPPVSGEYKIRYAALKSKEPKAIWNFFDIVCEMFLRKDVNAASLLHMITADCLAVDQLVVWWYQAKLMESAKWHTQLFSLKNNGQQSNSYVQSLFQASALFDMIVELWKITALNPKITPYEKEQLNCLLQFYHKQAVKQIMKALKKPEKMKMMINNEGSTLTTRTASFKVEFFPGFYSAIQACHVDFNSSELRCIPTSATRFSHLSDYEDDCLNIPILRNNQSFFQKELKSLNVTTAYGTGPQPASSSRSHRHQQSQSRPHKTSKKKKRRPLHKNHHNRQPVSNQSSSSGSACTADFSAEEDSPPDDEDGEHHQKEAYELELDEFFALTHEEREPFHVRFDACDALAHHGYIPEAIYMSIKLAKDMLQNVPDVLYEGMAYENKPVEWATVNEDNNPFTSMRKVKKPICSGLLIARPLESCPQKMEVQLPRQKALATAKIAVDYLERVLKLIRILLGGFNTSNKYEVNRQTIVAEEAYNIVIELGTTALSLQRYASPSHQHEIYLNYLEDEIFEALRTVKLTNSNTVFLRQLAIATITRCRVTTTDILPPTLLSLFLVEALTFSGKIVKASGEALVRDYTDNELGYQVALGCLEMKLSYVEEDYPMLFECFRKHRRTMAVELIVQFKDDPCSLGLVLDKLLDPTTHKMQDDHDSNAAYFLRRDKILQEHTPEGKRPIYPWTRKDKASRKCSGPDGVPLDDQKPGSSMSVTKSNVKNIPSLLDSIRPLRPSVTPHATEALAHFYCELANIIHQAGGGSNNNSIIFNNNNIINMNVMVRIHRNLHMCAFLIGLYAVGIYNQTVRNWPLRTQFGYNVGWLHNQALEIGVPALEIVRKTWMQHFTPLEIAALADKASNRPDPEILKQGALLALSVLWKAEKLPPNEVIQRLKQVRENDLDMAEEACVILEKIGNANYGFSSQALYQAARYWHESYENINQAGGSMYSSSAEQQAQYQILNSASEQYHRYVVPPPPPPPPPYYNQGPMPPYPPPLHPSHSAPNLLPQNNMHFYPFDAAYSCFAPSTCGKYDSYYLHKNPPHTQKSMPNPIHNMNYAPPVSALPPPVPYNYHLHNINIPSSPHNMLIQVNDKRLTKLLNAYRVGILAIKSQRYAENDRKVFGESITAPQYEDDLSFLFRVCTKLGLLYVNSFFDHVTTFVTSPKILLKFVGISQEFYGTKDHPGAGFHQIQNLHGYFDYQMPIGTGMSPSNPLISLVTERPGSIGSGNISPSTMSLTIWKNTLLLDQKFIRNAMNHHADQTIKVMSKCIEMFYYAFLYRLNFPKLLDSDLTSLRLLLGECRQAFIQIPNGISRFDAFIKFWKSYKGNKKKASTDTSIKEIFDEYLGSKDMADSMYSC